MIREIFRNLCSNLEISEERVREIDMHKKNIEACLDKYFSNKAASNNSQFIGSYGRNTAIYTENIRLLVTLPDELYWKISIDIKDLLEYMKNALMEKYITCEYSDNGNGLNINVNGALSFEIVPGFIFNKGEYIYLYSGVWRKLNLKEERNNFYQLNNNFNNNLVDLCRILKIWKNYYNIDVANILLDTLAYYFFKDKDKKYYSYDYYDEMILAFFKYLIDNCKRDTFLSFDGTTVLKKRIDLYDIVFYSLTMIETAVASAKCGMKSEAAADWKQILGYSMF